MPNPLLIATSTGLAICNRVNNQWDETYRGLDDRHIAAVMAREGVILAGTPEGVYRSDDLGRTWQSASNGLTAPYVRWMVFHPDVSDFEFVGTEPANIFVSHNGGESWRICPELEPLRTAGHWFMPYSPEAGCVRSFAFHGSRGYAAVEVGGVLVSDDSGETWRLAGGSNGQGTFSIPPVPGIASDLHSVYTHPTSPDFVVACTHLGLYRSENGGVGWENLYQCYCRAGWVDPADSNHIIFGPADTVDEGGRIEETRDGGRTWQLRMTGLPDKWPHQMVERFTPVNDELIATLASGELFSAPITTLEWQPLLPHIDDANAVAVMI
jgi:photosystem II stability/assembly factor-like uncharacterized protein